MTDTTENKRFPGRQNYTGPKSGRFGLLNQYILFEKSHNVIERVEYVKAHKPASEVAIRLHNMIYLDPAECPAVVEVEVLDADYRAKCATLYADYEAKRAPLYADYRAKRAPLYADYRAKRATLYADYEAKRATLYADYWAKRAPLASNILSYIRSHIPDCAWNGSELVFENEEEIL